MDIGLSTEDIEAVRVAVLAHMQEEGQTCADVAVQCRLSYWSVARFLEDRSNSERVVAHLVAYLPLRLLYERSRISTHR